MPSPSRNRITENKDCEPQHQSYVSAVKDARARWPNTKAEKVGNVSTLSDAIDQVRETTAGYQSRT
jgi:hypothetical protein